MGSVEMGFFSSNLCESDTPFWHLSWQAQLLSFQHFCDIQIEEIAVQNGLHNSSHYGDHVKEALKVEPPNPVDEVEGSVQSQEKQIMCGDGLGLSCFTDHEQLRQDRH